MIDHTGIVCNKNEIKKMIDLFKSFGYKMQYSNIIKEYNVKCIFLNNDDIFDTEIELIIPLNNKSVVSKCLKNEKNRLHHIAYTVKSIKNFKHKLKPYRVKGAKPNMYVTFLNPKKYGILVELVQYD